MINQSDGKKKYIAPEILSEDISVGVFGSYGGCGDGFTGSGQLDPFIPAFNPVFGWCCGG